MPEGPEPVAYDQSQDNRYVIEKQQQPATRRVSFMPPTDHVDFGRFLILSKLLYTPFLAEMSLLPRFRRIENTLFSCASAVQLFVVAHCC